VEVRAAPSAGQPKAQAVLGVPAQVVLVVLVAALLVSVGQRVLEQMGPTAARVNHVVASTLREITCHRLTAPVREGLQRASPRCSPVRQGTR
jgi:hypothetical protein